MRKIIAMILALIFAMNFAVASFASAAVTAIDDETITTVVDETNDETDDTIVDETEDETVEDESVGEMPSLLENDFIRFILDLIEILKSTFRFLEKISNK